MLNPDLYPFLSRFSNKIALRYEQRRRREFLRLLKTADPDFFENIGEKSALLTFKSTAKRVPYYRTLLESCGIDWRSVNNMDDFRRLPILDKKIFHTAEISDLSLDGKFPKAKNILTSSGFSGIFSFGVNLQKNIENTARLIDTVLDFVLEVGNKKTLLINCLPMGVKVHTNVMVLAETSVREDMALAVVQKFHPYFEQIIIVGEAFFIKNLIEEGLEANINWKNLQVSLILGEDSFPESYRTYMGTLIGVQPDERNLDRIIGSSLGIAEIDLNLFHETPDTIRIRRFAEANPDFRKSLFGQETEISPMLFHYYPHRTYLETDQNGDIIITTNFTPAAIPLIRYNTGDSGKIISYRTIEEILKKFGKTELKPDLKLPLVAVRGRHLESPENFRVTEKVRHLIFADPEIAKRVTGYFKINSAQNQLTVAIQLKKKYSTTSDKNTIAERLILPQATIHVLEYYEFHEALTLNYEKKFHHL